MTSRGCVTKFFISNLPEGYTPWELRSSLEGLGDILGTFVAKKRDKSGSRFGFASFSGVSDVKELEKKIRGIRMGEFKLRANVARFAVEYSGLPAIPESKTQAPRSGGGVAGSKSFNFRDAWSYRDVVGKSFGGGESGWGPESSFAGASREGFRSLVIPDRAGAFKELEGLAVVGRTVNLETLVDLEELLKIANIVISRIQYLGGLSFLISFPDSVAASSFLESKSVWGPWFSKLDAWIGQPLNFERVAWLKLIGIPPHLMEPDILAMVGESFGKLLHAPKSLEEDLDLSITRVVVLVGDVNRIEEVVSLKWKGRSFRIRVEE